MVAVHWLLIGELGCGVMSVRLLVVVEGFRLLVLKKRKRRRRWRWRRSGRRRCRRSDGRWRMRRPLMMFCRRDGTVDFLVFTHGTLFDGKLKFFAEMFDGRLDTVESGILANLLSNGRAEQMTSATGPFPFLFSSVRNYEFRLENE